MVRTVLLNFEPVLKVAYILSSANKVDESILDLNTQIILDSRSSEIKKCGVILLLKVLHLDSTLELRRTTELHCKSLPVMLDLSVNSLL